ncbi:hypothetical protein [Algibacter lectus]|uniref:hypothetical protein n=1 Tax=Algibacter lectus TaxID=221126 RepID=UPI0026ED1D95|nr:hypothetical protein [Algibacter lectus]MDO7137554.1 hypothetical protein [Algibacter lectus]
MKFIKLLCVFVFALSFFSCASRYSVIEPNNLNYVSKSETGGVTLEYKYDLLDKKYSKKEDKKGIRLVAVKISNNSNKDLVFGRDLNLVYANENEIYILDKEKTFKTLKQSPATHLFYLLLTPVNFYTSKTNEYGLQETTSSTPVGLILGPGLAAGNLIAASSANKKFKTELANFDIKGSTIKQGEVKYGLVGIDSQSYDALKLSLK